MPSPASARSWPCAAAMRGSAPRSRGASTRSGSCPRCATSPGDVIDFVVAEVNANAARLIGRPRDEIVSRRLSELWPHQLAAALHRALGLGHAGARGPRRGAGRLAPRRRRPLDPSPDRAPGGRRRHRRARHHRPPPGGRGPPPARGAGPPVAEDGGDRPPGRRSRPRLQQPAHRDPRPRRADPSQARRRPSAAPQPAGDRPRRRARFRAHPPAPGLQPQAGAAAAHPGPRRGRGADEHAAPAAHRRGRRAGHAAAGKRSAAFAPTPRRWSR